MPRRSSLQTNFSAGELDPNLQMRQDTEQYQNGAKSLRNRRCLIGGGTKRRPGSWRLLELTANSRLEEFVVNESTKYVLAFSNGRMDAYVVNISTGFVTAAGSVTSAPWDETVAFEMDYAQVGNTLFLAHQDMAPQIILRTSASTWSRSALTFATGPAARPEQPYLKIVDPAITLQPSARTGSITLTASSAIFVDDHVGQYIRYLERACLITAVNVNGLSCTATVIEKLPNSQDLTVTASADFAVGEIVEGETTGARGEVTSIPDGTSIVVVILDKLVNFSTETLIGPNATTTVSGVTDATLAAVTDWDEQLFGPVYGYPGTVELHRNRLLYGGHVSAPEYLITSGLGDLYNFNAGDASDADAIIEPIGDAGASRIKALHSSEQLLVLTDHGPYYVNENPTSPFRPSGIAFFPFGSSWPISDRARPREFDNGVILVSESLIIKASPTGDLTRSWTAGETSLQSAHLIKQPIDLTVTSNFAGGSERYAVLLNTDHTLAVMQLIEGQSLRNFTPWDTNGEYHSVCALSQYLYATVKRTINESVGYFLELFDQDLTLDCATEVEDLEDIPTTYGVTPVNVVVDNFYLGIYDDGLPVASPPDGPYIAGFNYETVVQTLPPIVEDEEGDKSGDYMRILEAVVFVLTSARFSAQGYTLSAYQIGDDFSVASLLSGPQRFQSLGWEREPTVTITQVDPLPLDVLAVKSTVAF